MWENILSRVSRCTYGRRFNITNMHSDAYVSMLYVSIGSTVLFVCLIGADFSFVCVYDRRNSSKLLSKYTLKIYSTAHPTYRHTTHTSQVRSQCMHICNINSHHCSMLLRRFPTLIKCNASTVKRIET